MNSALHVAVTKGGYYEPLIFKWRNSGTNFWTFDKTQI